MAKDKSEKKEKKDKKEKKKEKLHDDGVQKSKKEKKEKKLSEKGAKEVDALLDAAETNGTPAKGKKGASKKTDVDMEDAPLRVVPKEALVPFANPLADEKQTKKVLRSVKKAAKHKVLKRGVKEVVKSVRKTESSNPSSAGSKDPVGIVILAADISPMDVISHIPVLCEDSNIPYIYVQSRAELGMAGNTKRPTSVVMVSKEKGKGKPVEDDEYKETYAELLKLVLKAGGTVKL